MILKFLNLLDANDRLSITNLCIYAMLVKGLIFQVDICDAVIFAALIASYCHRRYQNNRSETLYRLDQKLIKIETTLRDANYEIASFKDIATRMDKQSNEVEKIITGKTFERVFNPTGRML